MPSTKFLILDFDGVLVDSAFECWSRCLDVCKSDKVFSNTKFNETLKNSFFKYRYLVGPAREFYFLMKSLSHSFNPEDVKENFRKFSSLDKLKSEEFEKNFFLSRKIAKQNNKKKWIESNYFFEPVIKLARVFSDKNRLFIATLKDKKSVIDLLKYKNLNINDSHILDLGYGDNKFDHISKILKINSNLSTNNFMFIDDNIKHIMETAPLGISTFLATWAYNKFKKIESDKIKTLSLEDCSKIIIDA